MAGYLGNIPTSTDFVTDLFSGDNSTVTFTLSESPATKNAVAVYVNGVKQYVNTYNTIGTSLSFNQAPPAGTNNIEVVHLGVRRSINTPAQNSVTSNEIDANSIGAIKAKLAISGSEVANVPAGNISATDIQSAVNELDVEKEPADPSILKTSNIGSTVQAHNANLDSISSYGVGTGANQIVRLDASARLPAVDGSLLTGIGLGVGQTWQDVTASRIENTVYYNSTGKSIFVSILCHTTLGSGPTLQVNTGTGYVSSGTSAGAFDTVYTVVPNGAYYKLISNGGTSTAMTWTELR